MTIDPFDFALLRRVPNGPRVCTALGRAARWARGLTVEIEN